VVPLGRLTVVTGANGAGKSSLYRVLRLLAATAHGGAVRALAAEGGLQSVLWAGPEVFGEGVRRGRHPVTGTVRSRPVALRIGLGGDDLGYAIDFGLPRPDDTTMFDRDPEIKLEVVWSGPVLRPSTMLSQRARAAVMNRSPRCPTRWPPRRCSPSATGCAAGASTTPSGPTRTHRRAAPG
jgi:predicted ATPase